MWNSCNLQLIIFSCIIAALVTSIQQFQPVETVHTVPSIARKCAHPVCGNQKQITSSLTFCSSWLWYVCPCWKISGADLGTYSGAGTGLCTIKDPVNGPMGRFLSPIKMPQSSCSGNVPNILFSFLLFNSPQQMLMMFPPSCCLGSKWRRVQFEEAQCSHIHVTMVPPHLLRAF